MRHARVGGCAFCWLVDVVHERGFRWRWLAFVLLGPAAPRGGVYKWKNGLLSLVIGPKGQAIVYRMCGHEAAVLPSMEQTRTAIMLISIALSFSSVCVHELFPTIDSLLPAAHPVANSRAPRPCWVAIICC
jgi:hypothetical protein